jgi:putative serine protease PepD
VIGGHLGSRVSALLDGQLSAAEAERAWAHVHACHTCRDLVEREGWVKTRLAGLSFDAGAAPDHLKGSLLGPARSPGLPPAPHPASAYDARPRRQLGLVALGGGAIGAAVMGVLALGVAPARRCAGWAPRSGAVWVLGENGRVTDHRDDAAPTGGGDAPTREASWMPPVAQPRPGAGADVGPGRPWGVGPSGAWSPQQPPPYQPMWGAPAPPPAPRGRVPGWLWPAVAALALVLGLVGGAVGSWLFDRADDDPAATSAPPQLPSRGEQAGGKGASPIVAVADHVLPSVVSIAVRGPADSVTGSGFVYDRQGRIVTNNHVIEPAAEQGRIVVTLSDGRDVSATLVGRSPSYDLAVIEIDRVEGLRPVTLGTSSSVRVGQEVVAIGSPLGLNATVTSGIISATERPVTAGGSDEKSFINAVQTDAAINPGNSGGPLVDLDGLVVGVNSAIATVGGSPQAGNIGVGFAIPIDQVVTTVTQIIETGRAQYPVIGAEVSVAANAGGARVNDITDGSPADRAGMRSGDLITRIDGVEVADGIELIVRIRSYAPGDSVTLTVRREGRTEQIEVVLGREDG